MSRFSGVALYREGIKKKGDPSVTEAEWVDYRRRLEDANVAFRFRMKRKDKIKVY